MECRVFKAGTSTSPLSNPKEKVEKPTHFFINVK